MKRIIAVLLLLSMTVCLFGCGGESNAKSQTQPLADLGDYDLYAGYGKVDFTPESPVPLAGYGSADKRISRAVLDPLYVLALALTDSSGETILLMNWDGVRSYTEIQQLARVSIAEATGLDISKIYIGATHTHSAPEMTNKLDNAVQYAAYVVEKATEAAVIAMEDRRPANMSAGTIEVEGLNFVRHYTYVDKDGQTQYFGDNFGTAIFDETTAHTTQADPTMFMLYFQRQDGEDISFVNWRAHPHLTGGPTKYDISADWVGAFRNAVEYQTGAKVIYFNGAAGNINEKSRINDENLTIDHAEYGALLANYAIELMDELVPVTVDSISTRQTVYAAAVNHSQDDKFLKAKEFQANSTAIGVFDSEGALEFGIRSSYHANAIISNYNRPESLEVELNAILLGQDVALVTAPNELFDTNSVWLEECAPTAYTLTLCYTNGHYGYVPSGYAWEHTCYETDISYFEKGTAENYQQCFLDMIGEMKG